MRRLILLMVNLVLGLLCALPTLAVHHPVNHPIRSVVQATPTQTPVPATNLLTVRISPIVDFYFLLRLQADAKSTTAPPDEDFAAAISAVRHLDEVFGSNSDVWGILNVSLNDCQTASDVTAAFSRLPESLRAGTIPLREGAMKLANAMSTLEPLFLKTTWPRHKKLLDQRMKEIKRDLEPKSEQSLSFLTKHLRFDVPLPQLTFYLVGELPEPGAISYFLRNGSRLSVVSVRNKGNWLFAAILYEAAHTLFRLDRKRLILEDVRDRMQKVQASDSEIQDLVLALLFVHSVETVQRIIDNSKEKFGDLAALDARFPLASTIIVPLWSEYLDGKIQYTEALDQIVSRYMQARKQSTGPKVSP